MGCVRASVERAQLKRKITRTCHSACTIVFQHASAMPVPALLRKLSDDATPSVIVSFLPL